MPIARGTSGIHMGVLYHIVEIMLLGAGKGGDVVRLF